MADIGTPTTHETRPRGRSSYPVANNVTLYPGALVQVNTSGAAGVDGCLDHWDKTGIFVGIVVGGDANTTAGGILGDSSESPRPEARVDESGAIITHVNVTGAAQTDVGNLVYCATSNPADMTITDAANAVVGRLVRFRTASDCDVELFTPAEHRAGVAGTTWTT